MAINLIFLQSGTANKLLEMMKEAKLLEEKEEVEVKTQEKVRTRISPKAAMSITTSQEEDSDYSEVDSTIAEEKNTIVLSTSSLLIP